jgi:tetratricopeptide (TPR) repeat protein
MARKKRPAGGGGGKRGRRGKPQPPPQKLDLPDRRALERSMQEIMHGLGGGRGQGTPLDRAQELMYQAFEQRDPEQRVRLAHEALEISPDCADAYVLLAEHAPTRKQALRLWEEGVAAGERALGPESFKEATGHFWGVLETRPYMRAREGLASSLWTAGRRDEAVEHLREMLRLNPNDNQGVRYTLLSFLLALDRDDDAARLIEQYPQEGLATWAWSKALLAFRREGDTPESRRLLAAAKKKNKHVTDYLTGRKYPPSERPGYYGMGDENEALVYVGSFLPAWKSTLGAIQWLRANDESTSATGPAPRARGPLPMVKKWLTKNLPQTSDVWQVSCQQLPRPLNIGGERVRLWIILVYNFTADLVLAHVLQQDEPAEAGLWDALAQAMQNPVAGEPHRPAEVQVRGHERWEGLQSHLREVGVEPVVMDSLPRMDALIGDMTEHLAGPAQPGLLDMPGITPQRVASFFEAAAHYFHQSPWRKVGYESAIQVECRKFTGGPWYAVVMGQSGLTLGLALYEDLGLLRRMWRDDLSDEENARRTVATSVTFGEEVDLPSADVEAVRQHGWQVARLDAYPSVLHKERGMTMRRPLAWELELMEACLRAVPDFVNRRQQDDTAPEDVTVSAAGGELKLRLAWVAEEQES